MSSQSITSKRKTSGYVGRYSFYPDRTGARLGEGGSRLKGVFKDGQSNRPLVTIITVCWNSAETIEQTIQSVLNQSYDNIEHVIVDGGSNDRTLDILREHDATLSYWVSEPDMGLYFAMNKGLELSRGEYILILNADDWYLPYCVEELVKAQLAHEADFVSGLANYVDQKGNHLRTQPVFPYDAGLYFRMPLRHSTMLLSKALYEAYGPYDTRYFVNADRALTTKLFQAGVTHHAVEQPLMCFRDTGVSSTNMGKLYGERERMISRYFPGLPHDDIAALGRLHSLRPQRLMRIVTSYENPEFTSAACAYALDRQKRSGPGEWKDFDFSDLVASAEKINRASDATTSRKPHLRNIATITTSDHGGAGKGSLRRVEALRRQGLNAEIYCLFKKTSYAHVDRLLPALPNAPHLTEPELRQAWREAALVTKEEAPGMNVNEMVSKSGGIIDFRQHLAVFEQADIIHLHWVVGLFDYENAGEVFGDTPVVWTLADMATFSGGVHYTQGHDNYIDECKDFPFMGPHGSIVHESWMRQAEAYSQIKNLHIVCPSQWLADCAKASSLFRDRPVHMIPNALPVDRFRPTNKLTARLKLGLPLDKKIVAFGAESLANRRKGGDILSESVKILKDKGFAENLHGLFFGNAGLDLGIPSHLMGYVSDEQKMSLIYAAADVFAFPSREDNAPLTVVESLLSGTPVVSFPVGNVPELVRHKDTGYIARYEDAEDFANGLVYILKQSDTEEGVRRGLRSRIHAQAHNDPDTAARRHIALYESILANETANFS